MDYHLSAHTAKNITPNNSAEMNSLAFAKSKETCTTVPKPESTESNKVLSYMNISITNLKPKSNIYNITLRRALTANLRSSDNLYNQRYLRKSNKY